MQFVTARNPMDRAYYASPGGYFGEFEQSNDRKIEDAINIKEIGQSVPEGQRFGSFIQTTQNAIRMGAGKIELSSSMGRGEESVGAEAYGRDARQALREIAKANQVEFTTVHTPPQIGNLSGFNPQERGFSDEYRKTGMEEVKRAIELASDIGGGGVVVHTGEYQRDISDQPWARDENGNFKFLNYSEEPGKATLYMVDERTGRLITEVRKNMIVHEPLFKTEYNRKEQRHRWVDKDGKPLDESKIDDLFKRLPEWDDEHKRFKTKPLTWEDFVARAEEWNKFHPKANGHKWTPEELFLRSQMETRILQARGSSLFHSREYKDEKDSRDELLKMYEYFKAIEEKVPKEEQWKLFEQQRKIRGRALSGGGAELVARHAPTENKLPSEIIKRIIDKVDLDMKFIHESSAAADAQAEETTESLKHVMPVADYAKREAAKSYAEAGIYAMERTQNNPYVKKDVYIAPENIFPEMGFGSHPEELIELVQRGRKEMVRRLTSRMVEDPGERRDREGNLVRVPNPDYNPGLSKSEAEKLASKHIRATLDTQHLGMWWKHFVPKPGESREARKERFDKWYMEQVEKLEKEDIVGHIHVVDAIGAGHQHLPVGQGNLPVRKALEYLKKKGYRGTMISEAYGEDTIHGPGRILTETWTGLGTPIRGAGYRIGAPPRLWQDVDNSYFGVTQNPYFIFGAYSPSNDWQLWSQVPME